MDHLSKQTFEIPESECSRWKKVDASLCVVLWFSIDAKLQPRYQPFHTCYEVWTKAKMIFSNDVYRLYGVVSSFISLKLENTDVQSYLGKLDRLIVNFDSLMPFTDDAAKNSTQYSKFFRFLLLLAFHEYTRCAIKSCQALLFLHMALLVSNYCASPLLVFAHPFAPINPTRTVLLFSPIPALGVGRVVDVVGRMGDVVVENNGLTVIIVTSLDMLRQNVVPRHENSPKCNANMPVLLHEAHLLKSLS
jgi:hypothetical protein